jgi:hypothetical protein
MNAQESLLIDLDIKTAKSYNLHLFNKSSTITNIVGDKQMIALIEKEGTKFPTYEAKEVESDYVLNWKKPNKEETGFDLDLIKSVTRNFKDNKPNGVSINEAVKTIASGNANKDGITFIAVFTDAFKAAQGDVLEALNEMFLNGFEDNLIKVKETYDVTNKKEMVLSANNILDVISKEVFTFAKMEKGKAYFTIDAVISSESKGTKFAEMKGNSKKEFIYNIEKKHMEHMSGTYSIVTNIAIEGDLTISVTNNAQQKYEVKKK